MNGATPVPGPIMIIGVVDPAGGRKCGERWTYTCTGPSSALSAR